MTANDTEKLLNFYRLQSHSLQSELETERSRVNYWRDKSKHYRVKAIRWEMAATGTAVVAVVLAVMLIGRW